MDEILSVKYEEKSSGVITTMIKTEHGVSCQSAKSGEQVWTPEQVRDWASYSRRHQRR